MMRCLPPCLSFNCLEFCHILPTGEDEGFFLSARQDDTALKGCCNAKSTRDAEGMTPWYHAATDIAHALVAARAELDARSTRLRMAPHIAAVHAHLEAVRFLVENATQKDLQDFGKSTPLLLAVHRGHIDIPVHMPSTRKDTALDRAAGAMRRWFAICRSSRQTRQVHRRFGDLKLDEHERSEGETGECLIWRFL